MKDIMDCFKGVFVSKILPTFLKEKSRSRYIFPVRLHVVVTSREIVLQQQLDISETKLLTFSLDTWNLSTVDFK